MTRVLIIDDQPNFRRQLRLLLERAGLEVIADIDDIASAEALLESLQPDLAVVDVLLGDASGIEGTVRLKNLAPKMRVILVSAYHDNHLKTSAKAVGAEAFIPKDELDLSIVLSWDKKKEKK
ncbi:MAG: response regulator transcription factor [Anaerolineaceae bacterium]|nr:response regulator transcription factor [Anaerolineaceae bacterium]